MPVFPMSYADPTGRTVIPLVLITSISSTLAFGVGSLWHLAMFKDEVKRT
jgi:hypothetical protein